MNQYQIVLLTACKQSEGIKYGKYNNDGVGV